MTLDSGSFEFCGSFAHRPRSAVNLLDSLARWRNRSGGAPAWKLEDGVLEVVPGSGDLVSEVRSSEYQLHAEFWLPKMRAAEPQDRANGGIYLHGRFEIQLLDSSDQPLGVDTCGAIYKAFTPLRRAAFGAGRWQCLEVAFRTSGGAALVTAFLNGLLIHNQVLVAQPTPGALDEAPFPALMLQDHGAPIRFRNVWLL